MTGYLLQEKRRLWGRPCRSLKSEVRGVTPVLRWRRSLAAFGASGLQVWFDDLLNSVVGFDRRNDLRQFLTVDDHFDLRCVQHFSLDQGQRDSYQNFAVV